MRFRKILPFVAMLLVAPYAKRFGTLRTLETADDILMMLPFLASSMAGRKAAHAERDFTFSSKEESQSFSEQSRIAVFTFNLSTI